MFSIFKKKDTSLPLSLAFMQSDWHCHLLPHLDDGARSEADTLQMLHEYVRLGFQKIVATPHVHSDFFNNSTHTIQTAATQIQALIAQHQLPLTLEAAAEYYANENFLKLIEQNDLLLIDNQYVLFELPMQQPPVLGLKLVEKIQQKGHVPLLAHPERYRYWHGRTQVWADWKNAGVCFQLNLLSLTGFYGRAEQRTAEQLLDADAIEALGSDAHGVRHLQKLAELSKSSYFAALQQLPLLNRLD